MHDSILVRMECRVVRLSTIRQVIAGLMKKTRNYPKSHKVAQDCIDCRVKGKNVEATSAQKTCDTCKWHLDPFSGARKNLNIGRKARKYQTQKLIIARAAAVSTLTENETYELPWGSSSFSEAGRFQHNLIPQRSSLNRALPGSMAEWTQEILQWARAKTTISRCLTVSSL